MKLHGWACPSLETNQESQSYHYSDQIERKAHMLPGRWGLRHFLTGNLPELCLGQSHDPPSTDFPLKQRNLWQRGLHTRSEFLFQFVSVFTKLKNYLRYLHAINIRNFKYYIQSHGFWQMKIPGWPLSFSPIPFLLLWNPSSSGSRWQLSNFCVLPRNPLNREWLFCSRLCFPEHNAFETHPRGRLYHVSLSVCVALLMEESYWVEWQRL